MKLRLLMFLLGLCLRPCFGALPSQGSVASAGAYPAQGLPGHCRGDNPEAVASGGVESPQLIAQSGHSEDVTAMTFSPRSTVLATGSKDGTVKLWRVQSGQLLRTLSTSTYWVHSVAFSSDGCLVAAGGGDHKIYIWNLDTDKLVTTLEPHAGAVEALAFSADGHLMASSTTGHGSKPVNPRTIVWDVQTWQERTPLQCDGCAIEIRDLAFLPGSSVLALKTKAQILLWNYETNRIEQKIDSSYEGGGRLFVSRDGTRLASSGAEPQAHKTDQYTRYTYAAGIAVWGVSNGRVDENSTVHLRDVWAIGIAPDGGSIVAQQTGQLTLYGGSSLPKPDPTKVMKIAVCPIPTAACQPEGERSLPGIQLATLSPDGMRFAYSTANGVGFAETGSSGSLQLASSRASGVTAILYSGSILAVGLREGQISVWDQSLVSPAHTFQQPIQDVGRGLKGFSLNSAKGELLSAGADGGVMGWGLTTPGNRQLQAPSVGSRGDWFVSGREEAGLTRPEAPKALMVSLNGVPQNPATEEVLVAALSPSGTIATGGLYFDEAVTNGFVSLRDGNGVPIGDRIMDNQRDGDDVTALSFSPDGQTLAIGFSGGGIDLWSVADKKVIARFDEHTYGITALAYSSSGEYLASASRDKTVKVWPLKSPGHARTLSGLSSPALCVSFSAEGDDLLASGGAGNQIILWRASSGERVRTLEGHSSPVNTLAFAPHGQVLVSGGEDGTVRFWDTARFQPIATLIAVRGGGWLTSTPSGFFDGSEGTWDQVVWQFDRNLFDISPVEIGFRDYFLPNLLAKSLSGQPPAAARPLASLNRAQPMVRIESVRPDGPETVQVDVEAESEPSAMQRNQTGQPLLSGIYDLRLFRNGQFVGMRPQAQPSADPAEAQDVEGWRRSHAVPAGSDGKAKVSFRGIRLTKFSSGGKSVFTAYAFNRDRVKSSTSAPFEYQDRSAGERPPRRAYLITMGVNANQSGWNLDVAVPSAEKARSLLHAKLAERYSTVVDVPLYSDLGDDGAVSVKHARKAALKAVLDLLSGAPVDAALRDEVDSAHQLRPATPDDAVVLYVASHGYADPQGNLYVVPFDTGASFGISEEVLNRCASRPGEAGVCGQAHSFLQHAVSSADLSAWWQGVDAGELVMILDSCHSGALPGRTFRPGPLGDPGFGQLSYDKRMILLSASQPAQTELGVWVTGGEGRTLLVDALVSVAGSNAGQSLAQWLKGVERQLPVTMSKLYPTMKESDLQSPVLLDFSGSDLQSVASVPAKPPSPPAGPTLQLRVH